MTSIFNLTPEELNEWLIQRGHPAFAANQIIQWLYKHQVASAEEMTNISKPLRADLLDHFDIDTPPIVDTHSDPSDGTQKVLFQLADGEGVETVLMPQFTNVKTDPETGEVKNWHPGDIKEYTICVSTQVGCMYACRFCASGQTGLKRHLTTGEIIAQLMAFLREKKNVTRIVFMGMGEPLHNLDQVKKAIEILSHPKGLGLSRRRFTVSTVGLVPEIYRMAQEDWNVKLAVSLHSTTDENRAKLIPLAQGYQLDQLMDALRFYQRREGRRISFEYLMIQGLNDTNKDAQRLKSLCEGIKAHFNLIPFNPTPNTSFQPSSPAAIQQFRLHLRKAGLDATVRYSRGRQIEGACGQLRLRNL
ncbi:MAG: 23S rRNA (adenine(2503)-C(2))-methyltransferase RlmN [bacterium]|jgi:23S rRNA (adenine2503-C2)-methyltransferase|nr:23S rRNA (adenine(2503)-C(2))-methyltransferase RlmN [bacterium]